MNLKYIYLLCSTILLLSSIGCSKEELAFDVVESPVLMEFVDADSAAEMFSMTATVYELDKSGILDNNVGITSTPVSGLSLNIYTDEDTLIESLTTDSNGVVTLIKDWSDMGFISQLEWTGEHNGVSFRIYKKI